VTPKILSPSLKKGKKIPSHFFFVCLVSVGDMKGTFIQVEWWSKKNQKIKNMLEREGTLFFCKNNYHSQDLIVLLSGGQGFLGFLTEKVD
jgi:hypothetical protein